MYSIYRYSISFVWFHSCVTIPLKSHIRTFILCFIGIYRIFFQYYDFSFLAGNVEVEVNGLCINDNKKKPLTLFQCQLKLFKDWVSLWNPQQQEYLLLRLKDLDAIFYTKYEEFLEHGENKPKDFFEPGVPAELVRASRKSSSTSSSPNVSLNGKESESEEDQDKDNIEDFQPLSTIQEDE